MRRIIHVTTSAVAMFGFAALGLCCGYAEMTHKRPFPTLENIFALTAICAWIISFVTQRWAMNPASWQTLKRIIAIQIGTGIFAGIGILVVMLAGSESAIGRTAIYVTLAIAALGTGFGMAYGYTLSWTQLDKPVSHSMRNPDAKSEPK